MGKILGVIGVVCLLAFVGPARADDAKLHEVVARAIKAHGGADVLTKFKATTSKQKGKFHGLGEALDYTSEESIQLPDRFRVEVHSKVGDQAFTFIQIINGDKGWRKIGDNTEELDKEMLEEAKEQMNSATISHLVCLNKKDYKLSSLGEVKVGDAPAIGIRVERKGFRDVSLFFDKDKSLLLKVETLGKDLMQGGQEYTSTILYDDYKKVEGMMVAYKITVQRDGKPYVDGEMTEVKLSEKLDDSVFEKP